MTANCKSSRRNKNFYIIFQVFALISGNFVSSTVVCNSSSCVDSTPLGLISLAETQIEKTNSNNNSSDVTFDLGAEDNLKGESSETFQLLELKSADFYAPLAGRKNTSNGDIKLQKYSETHELTSTLNGMLENYDKRIRPGFYGDPVRVGISIFVKSIASVSEIDMEYDLDFYLRQFWTDPRLTFEMKERPLGVIGLSQEFSSQIWQPDTNFPNEKRSYIHSATMMNEFIRLYPNGQILKSTRLTLTASCPMLLQNFPMDQQICSVDIGSYGYTKNNIEYYWIDGEESVVKGINSAILPQFQVKGHRLKNRISTTSTGDYSVLFCEFLFVRSLNFYLTQVYIPAALIVCISWLAFFMTREQIAERMALGVTSVLTITTLLMSTNSNSPKISYVKAIDIYLGVCFCNVFASLLESSAVGYLCKRVKEQKDSESDSESRATKRGQGGKEKGRKSSQVAKDEPRWPNLELELDLENCPCEPDSDTEQEGGMDLRSASGSKSGRVKAKRKSLCRLSTIDVASRVFFPAGFILFNVLYWLYYLRVSKSYLDDHNGHSWITP